jgi:hypothetical protein
MLIETKEQYEEIPDGTRLKVVLLGDAWEENTGTVNDCLKFKDKLYDSPLSYYLFSERNEKTATEDYSFVVIKTPGKEYEI